MVKKTEKAVSLGQRAKAKAQRAARAARELERGVSTRAGGKTSQGVERIPGTSTRNLGKGFGLRQTGEGKGSRMATKAQRDEVVKSGRRRIAGGSAASLLAGQSLFGDDKGKRTKPGGGVLDPNKAEKKESPNKAEKKESPKKYNVGVSKGGVPFKEAFKHHRGKGAKTFTWNGKKYTTELDTEKAKRTAAKKPDAKKPDKRGLIFGKDAKVRPFGGAIARVLLGKDEKFGGDRGAIDFLPGKSRPERKKKATGSPASGANRRPKPAEKAMGGMMKSKMASKGGAKGGRRPGGMQAGGMMKSKGMAKGGAMKKKGYAMGGMTKKGMAKGGAMTKKGMAKGGPVKKKAVSRKPRGVGAALRGYGKAMKK